MKIHNSIQAPMSVLPIIPSMANRPHRIQPNFHQNRGRLPRRAGANGLRCDDQ